MYFGESDNKGEIRVMEKIWDEIETIDVENTFGYEIKFYPNVEYVKKNNQALHLQIIVPKPFGQDEEQFQRPLIVFVQGSGWRKQPIYFNLPKMIRMCQKGYTVAIVEYRSSDIAPFPAQIKDVKDAIRFMKKYADAYDVDVSRIALWGDSSGGHTAVMAGITGEREMQGEENEEISSEVNCVIDWFGPVNIIEMVTESGNSYYDEPNSPLGDFIGHKKVSENIEVAQRTNILKYIYKKYETPPMLIMHGDKDQIVPFTQSLRLYKEMKEKNKDVRFICVKNAGHGNGGFSNERILQIVDQFIREKLQI